MPDDSDKLNNEAMYGASRSMQVLRSHVGIGSFIEYLSVGTRTIVQITSVVAQVETPIYRTQRRRSWRKFDVDQFRADLQSSCLCDGLINSSLGEDDSLGDDASVMASRLDKVVTALLDVHAPMTEITCRVRRSSR